MTTYYAQIDSPVGALLLTSDGAVLTGMYFLNAPVEESRRSLVAPDWVLDPAVAPFAETTAQLAAYFAGERQDFDLPLRAEGTGFQQRVWEELCRIPYGTTISYGELARRLGDANACRAVGLANGRNPIAIIVPCHRVIGANGKLTGYGGGMDRKKALLDLEARVGGGSPGVGEPQLALL